MPWRKGRGSTAPRCERQYCFQSWLLKLWCAQKSPLKLLKNAVYSGLSLGQISGVSILASTLRVSDDNPVDQILENVPIYGLKKG